MKKIWVLVGLLGLVAIGILFPDRIIDLIRSVAPQIRVRSEMVGVKVRGVDKQQMAKILEGQQFFLPGKVTKYQANGKQMEGIGVRKLTIVLTQEAQPLGQVIGAETREMYQSYGAEYEPTSKPGIYDLKILLYVEPKIVESEEAEKLSRRYVGLFMWAVWDLTHPKLANHVGLERLAGSQEWVRDNVGTNLIVIEKKERGQ